MSKMDTGIETLIGGRSTFCRLMLIKWQFRIWLGTIISGMDSARLAFFCRYIIPLGLHNTLGF